MSKVKELYMEMMDSATDCAFQGMTEEETKDRLIVETGNPKHPVSMIKLSNIESLDIVSGGKVNFQEFPVEGSKGKMYNVKKSGDHYSCDCTGFQYHGSCKHIKLVKDDRYE